MQKTLISTPALRMDLRHYARGEHQARHRDSFSRITLTLWGGFREETSRDSANVGAGDVLFKSHRVPHEDRFNASGARLASLVFLDKSFDLAGRDLWRVRRDQTMLRHSFAALEAAIAQDANGVSSAAADLLAHAEEPRRQLAPPAWLERLKQMLEEHSLATVHVAEEARSAGVHPVHASRLFRSCYGSTITEHAQTQSIRRSLAHLAGDTPLSEVALAAGFYDQSHMTRVFRRLTGRTPGAHRALLAAAG